MSGSGQEALPEFRVWSGSFSVGLGVVGRPSRRSGSGRKALAEVREGSEGPPGGPKVVGSGREALPEVRDWSGGPPGGP